MLADNNVYNSYLKGYGTTYIKDHLEKRGYLTPLGSKKWNQSYIIRILKNPFYCGTIVYRKEYVPDYLEQKKVKNKGQVEQIVVEGRHTPIITKRDFEKVQKIIELHSRHIDTKNKVGGGVPKSIWSEKLICKCGSSFNKRNYHYNSTSGMSYCYQCYRQKNFGSSAAPPRKAGRARRIWESGETPGRYRRCVRRESASYGASRPPVKREG